MKSLAFFFIFHFSLSSCGSTEQKSSDAITEGENTEIEKKKVATSGLPFVGERGFETRPGYSGTGTPHRFIHIRENGNVTLSFTQQNQVDREIIINEKYNAGKFQQYVKCVFKRLDNDTAYYEIDKDTIYEVDKNNVRLQSKDCCEAWYEDSVACPCKGLLFSTE
jgi:hypothetical protein